MASRSEQFKAALSPLVENLKDESSVAYLFVKRNAVAVQDALNHAIETVRLIRELIKTIASEIRDLRILSLLELFNYLALVESSATTLIDIVLLLLIAEGHDLHIERRFVRHVCRFEDLVKVDLWTKQEFLKEHGLKSVSRIFDRALRNKIAHLDFTIDAKGIIRIGKSEIDISQKLDSLFDNIETLGRVLVELGFEKKILNKMIKS